MNNLRAMQHEFLQAVFKRSGATLTATPRFSIYQNALQLNLCKSLQLTYPVCVQLVGEEFFKGLNHYYCQAHPPSSPNIDDYGDQLAGFIEKFPPASRLPYLADIARLEWALQQANIGEDSTGIDVKFLNQCLESEKWEALYCTLPDNASLIASTYPIEKIWQVNQIDYLGEKTVDLIDGGGCWLVWRPSFSPYPKTTFHKACDSCDYWKSHDVACIEPVDPHDQFLLTLIADKLSLQHVCERLSEYGKIDVGAAFNRLATRGWLCIT